MKTHCENFSKYLIGEGKDGVILTIARCKQWDCEYCADINKRRWQAIIIENVRRIGGQWYFMTLTSHERKTTMEASLENLQDGWKRLSARIRRVADKRVSYVRVYELHKNKRVHMHLLTTFEPPDVERYLGKSAHGSRWLKDNARACGIGYMTHVTAINGSEGLAAAYVTKYMTKTLADLPAKMRAIQTSQDIRHDTEDFISDYTWRVMDVVTEDDMMFYWGNNQNVTDVRRKEIITSDDFMDSSIYPF